MPKNKIGDLRDHLFETLEALKDDEHPMDIARANAVANVARQIIDTAKVEVSYLKTTGSLSATGFIPEDTADEMPVRAGRPVLAAPTVRR